MRVSNSPFIAAIADFDGLPIAGAILDLDGTVSAVNRAAVRLVGDRHVGDKAWRFAPQLETLWSVVVRGEFTGEIELETVGGKRPAQLVASLREHGGRRFVLVFVVEAPQPSAEQAVRFAGNQRLESLGLVAGGIAHEFNNQLVGVVSDAAGLREDETLPAAMRDALARIEAGARRMTQLTRQLLAFAGRGRFVTTLLDPDLLLLDCRDRVVRMMRPGTILAVDPGAGTFAVEADRGLLRQVIVDLVENASDALPGGKGHIHLASRIIAPDGTPWWELEIRDDGVGMDAATQARIFDPFFTTKVDRRGLGLSAVLGIVKRLAGEIAVESERGRGTCFRLRLPIVPGVAAPRRRSTSKQPPFEKLGGLRILVADDEATVRATVQRLLERRGMHVVLAVDGGEAERLLRTGTFDIVLLDVMMPKRTGYELVSVARETQPDAPVLLMSGYSEQARGVEPPDGFVEKPFNSSMLEGALQAALRGDGGRPGSEGN